jgi:uncharacterized membrane protein SpoIIM required for sporulation
MRQDIFEQRFSAEWQEFDEWLQVQLGAKPRGDKSYIAHHEVPARFRNLARHLALARDRHYGAQLVNRLEALVLGGHQAIYGAQVTESNAFVTFLRRTFPQLVREHWRSVLVASICLLGSMAGIIIAIQYFPDFAYVLVSQDQLAGMQQMYDPSNRRIGVRGADSDVQMLGHYIWNNVRIGFQCFAGGILFCVGSLFFMLYNGVVLGAVAGHITQVGHIETFWGFVAGHSALELFGIVLAGAAGLQIGYALIAPGRLKRIDALKAAIPDAIRILYGASGMIFLAAFVEAFWSSSRVPPVELKYAIGIAFWVLMAIYFVFVGRTKLAKTDARAKTGSD